MITGLIVGVMIFVNFALTVMPLMVLWLDNEYSRKEFLKDFLFLLLLGSIWLMQQLGSNIINRFVDYVFNE